MSHDHTHVAPHDGPSDGRPAQPGVHPGARPAQLGVQPEPRQTLAAWIADCPPGGMVFLGGAGVSTESGMATGAAAGAA